MKVLVTGFGPFRDVSNNPSARLIELMDEQSPALFKAAGLELTCRLLPVTWEGGRRVFDDAVVNARPDFTLHFGYTSHALGYQLEAGAANMTCEEADADGQCAATTDVIRDAQQRLETCFDLDVVQDRLDACGVPVSRSDDAGRYLCNYLYFYALEWAARANRPGTALFVHMPHFEDGVFGDTLALTGAKEILLECAAQLDGTGGPGRKDMT